MFIELLRSVAASGVAAAKAAGNAFLTAKAVAETDGAFITVKPGEWSQSNTPAAAAAASTSKAAGAAGTKHVCTSISATLAAGATAQAAAVIVALRDGASGAGTILWSKQVILPVNGVWELSISGLNIVGSDATAMTLEFTTAPAAGVFASVAMTGYDTT